MPPTPGARPHEGGAGGPGGRVVGQDGSRRINGHLAAG